MAQRYDIQVEQGATFSIEIEPQDANGDTLDLTGCSVDAEIRDTYYNDSGSVLATFSSSIDTDDGVITLTLSAATTAALTTVNGRWDCELTNADSTVLRLVEGKFKLLKEVTHGS